MKRKIRFDRLVMTLLVSIFTLTSAITLGVGLIGAKLLDNYHVVNFLDDMNEMALRETIVEVSAEEEPVEEIIEEDIITTEPEFIGVYRLTGYCACSICCGPWADGITASGTEATEGRTIAVDPNKIPLGSKVLINGQVYIAEDTGSAIKENRIDIYKDNHSDCFSKDCNGYAEVYLLVE